MMPVIENPKEAIAQSYLTPIAYKNTIIFRGVVIVKYIKSKLKHVI